MQTTDKALSLLRLFNEARPELGLSEFARLAGFDKATTRRFLMALIRNGFVEQNPLSKKYRLGSGILSLARVREETFPVSNLVKPVLQGLVEQTGETAHFSMFSGNELRSIEKVESPRSVRVTVNFSEALPLHGTASGIAFLSHQPAETVDRLLTGDLPAYTKNTMTEVREVKKQIQLARQNGVARVDGAFELETCGVAAAIFDWEGYSSGAVAVVTPSSRMTDQHFDVTCKAVKAAATTITRAFGAEVRETVMAAG